MKLISAIYRHNQDCAVVPIESIIKLLDGCEVLSPDWEVEQIEIDPDDHIPVQFTPVTHKMPTGASDGILLITEPKITDHKTRERTVRMFFYRKDGQIYTLGIEVPIAPDMHCVIDYAAATGHNPVSILVIPKDEVALYFLARD